MTREKTRKIGFFSLLIVTIAFACLLAYLAMPTGKYTLTATSSGPVVTPVAEPSMK